MDVINTMVERGFLKTSTDLEALRAHLNSGSRTFYIGFDPTADSLHVGHLLQVMVMAWFQRAGHRPIGILGGGTARIGDPTGKTEAREILTPETIAHNLACFRQQMSRFLDVREGSAFSDGNNDAILVDNAEWLCAVNYVDFLRDIGRHFSINRMLSAEGTKQRLERDQGMSFLEFNYHLLQSYDYLVLNERYDCSLQVGGDDQWFNILGGVDLIRRKTGTHVHAMTTPLLTTADGKKMGKTEKGALFIDPQRVSPYDYYQYWVNVADADAIRFMKLFTFMDMDRIEALAQLEGADVRQAKAVLAWEATALAHGAEEADKAQSAAKKLFAGGGISDDMPTLTTALPASVLDLYVAAGLTKSKGEARRLIKQGGARIDKERITDPEATLDREAILWAGKKRAVRILSE